MSGIVSYELSASKIGGNGTGFTSEGGIYQTFINDTGAVSIKGTIVVASTAISDAVQIAPASSVMPIGVIYEDGVADGNNVKVVTYGKAEVLLKDGEESNYGYWSAVSDVAGRMFQEATPNASEHYREIGHSLDEKTSGTDVLSLVQIHFN